MKNLIYFPYFEPSNDEWLKFSLLYLDKFQPIIPMNRQDAVTNNYKYIMDNTDLIQPYAPEYLQGDNAGISSIEYLEQILSAPDRYYIRYQTSNILKEWRNKREWKYLLYQEKFSPPFEEFCIENNFGKRVRNGLLLKEEVAYIFMTNLANEISKLTSSSIITDSNQFRQYANEDKAVTHRNNIAKSVINIKMPSNINDISFIELTKFRNDNRDLIKIFNQELTKFEAQLDETSPLNFLMQFEKIYKDLMKEIAALGTGISLASLSIYSMFNDGNILEEAMEASGELIGAGFALNSIVKRTNNKRQCVKYFANLQNLH